MINRKNYVLDIMSLPSRGAWIEILLSRLINQAIQSLPSRGAWIEISIYKIISNNNKSLPSRGAWIEIMNNRCQLQNLPSRSLHGERGLKLPQTPRTPSIHQSLPSRGAWIEIDFPFLRGIEYPSLPSRGAWIEIAILKEIKDTWHGRSLHGERGLK